MTKMKITRPVQFVTPAVLLAVVILVSTAASEAQTFSVSPTSLSFPPVTVGLAGTVGTVTVKNTGTSGNVIITSYAISPSEFQFMYGWAPVSLGPGALINYAIRLAPDAQQTFSGQFVITIQGVASPIIIPLSGSGVLTKAKSSLSVTGLDFPDTPAQTTSAPLSVTVTNVGTQSTSVNAVTADPPFLVAPMTLPQVVKPGQSITVNVSLVGTAPGSYSNTLTFGYNNLPTNGVALSGNVIAGTTVGTSTFPFLPFAVQGGPYLAYLQGAGGTSPYNWTLANGSTLPSGLTLSSSGQISGTVASTVAVANYPFSVSATDAASNSFVANFTLPVKPQTGANCNNIFMDIAGTTSPLVPINDLGTGTYLGSPGGLYPGGSNSRPTAFNAAGINIGQTIQPLDSNGNPDSVNGKIGFMSIGPSSLFDTFLTFMTDAYADPSINPKIVYVPAAQPRAYASNWADPNSGFWGAITESFLPQNQLSAAQVQVVYFLDADPLPSGAFPKDQYRLQSEIETIMQNIHSKFPNVKIVYFESPFYVGYSNGLNKTLNEPYGYEAGFAVKWAIQDQIKGNANLNWDPNAGPVMAPWMSWGSYSWANGLIPRNDGLVWACPDIKYDGFHPSLPYGREKDTAHILNFLKSDPTATPWFLAH